MKHPLESASQNTKHTSPKMQNEIIDCSEELIIENIAAVIKENRYYPSLCATDCAMKEQLALRFVDKSNIVGRSL